MSRLYTFYNDSPDKIDLLASNIDFFVTPFAHKEVAIIPFHPNTKDAMFGFHLSKDEIRSKTYVEDINDTVSSSAAMSFGSVK